MIGDMCEVYRMYEKTENNGCKPGRMWKLQNIRRRLSKFRHCLCYIVSCSKHSHIPAPSFKRLWKRARNFIVHIPDEFMFASSADINYFVFFTEEEKRFEICLVFYDNYLYLYFYNNCLLFQELTTENLVLCH
jgi:hypothetical protein